MDTALFCIGFPEASITFAVITELSSPVPKIEFGIIFSPILPGVYSIFNWAVFRLLQLL